MRLSVTARLTLLAFALTLVSNLALVALVWRQIHDDAIGALRRDTAEQSSALVALYRSGGIRALNSAVDAARSQGDATLIAAVLDPAGRRIAGAGPTQIAPARLMATSFQIERIGNEPPWATREAGISVRRIGAYWLLSGRLLDDWQQEQRAIERALFLATLLSLLLGLGASLVLTRYVARRLDRIVAVVRRVAADDLSQRVDLVAGRGDAFDRLAGELNAMLDKIERLMTELRVMTDSLAHNLRSPLARLRARAEEAASMPDIRQREAALAGLMAETDFLLRMFSTLIEISRSEAATRDRFTPIVPAALAGEVADLYAPVVEEIGLRFRLVADTAVAPIPMHRELMAQALTNLIDNALHHAVSGGELVLRVAGDSSMVRLQVEDRGPGIAEGEREQALRRFGRLDNAAATPGAGLGLALVDSVARLHGGRLVLSDNAPGLIATIELPRGYAALSGA